MRARWARPTAVVAAGMAVLVLGGCGGGDDGTAEPAAATTAAAATSAGEDTTETPAPETSAAAPADPDTTAVPADGPATTAAPAAGGTPNRCPLSAEQVSSALGAVVEDVGGCIFFPPDGSAPSAVFVRQVQFACNDDFPSELGYAETYDGLGLRAYMKQESADSALLLVCEEPQPFEISAEIPGDPAAALVAADALARLALESGTSSG